MTTSEVFKRCLFRLDGEMAKCGEEWYLAEVAAASNDNASNDCHPLPHPPQNRSGTRTHARPHAAATGINPSSLPQNFVTEFEIRGGLAGFEL